MSVKSYIIFSVIVVVWKCSALHVVDLNQCPDFSSVQRYDITKSVGVWYTYKIGDILESLFRCTQHEWRLHNNYILKTRTQKLHDIQITTKVRMDFINGTTALSVGWLPELKTYGWVVDTDYTSYAIWFLCIPDHEYKGITFMVTRERVPSTKVVQGATKGLAKLGFQIDMSTLRSVNQTQCE